VSRSRITDNDSRRAELGVAEIPAVPCWEAAAITGLSRDLLYDQMRAGKLAYLKVGRRRIITRQHLEAFLTRTT
jgi:excisionase family DNA binding protein